MNIEAMKQKKKELRLSYDALAAKANVSRRSVIGIFNGSTPTPRIDTIQKIEQALGLSPITEEEFNGGMRDYAVRNVTPEEDDVLEDFRQLGIKKGADAQRAAHEVIKAMLK